MKTCLILKFSSIFVISILTTTSILKTYPKIFQNLWNCIEINFTSKSIFTLFDDIDDDTYCSHHDRQGQKNEEEAYALMMQADDDHDKMGTGSMVANKTLLR